MEMYVLPATEFFNHARNQGEIIGSPNVTDEGVEFKGRDGLLLSTFSWPQWPRLAVTIRFRPASEGGEEQRFLHFGHVMGPRFLFETRSIEGKWALDLFVCGGDNRSLVLLDRRKLHPEDRWYEVRAELRQDRVVTLVGGEREGEAEFHYTPFSGGGASLGMRQNSVSHFSGVIDFVCLEPLE